MGNLYYLYIEDQSTILRASLWFSPPEKLGKVKAEFKDVLLPKTIHTGNIKLLKFCHVKEMTKSVALMLNFVNAAEKKRTGSKTEQKTYCSC